MAMSEMFFAEVGIPRDQRGRPLIVPRGESERKPYSRASGVASTLEDHFNIVKWQMRGLAKGLAGSRDLINMIAAEDYTSGFTDDPKENSAAGRRIDAHVEAAMRRGGTAQKADYGTAIHSLTEPGNRGDIVEQQVLDDVNSCLQLWADMGVRHVGTEVFTACDEIETAGTFDHLSFVPGYGICVTDKKGLPLDTPLPTPTGWTTMGEVAVGDQLFGSNGEVATVKGKSEIHHNPCVRITFDDGSSQVCDIDHRWPVFKTLGKKEVVVKTAGELVEIIANRKRGEHWAIKTMPGMVTPEGNLPLDPYFLGVWLGDGAAKKPEITISKEDLDILAELKRRGFATSVERDDPGCVRAYFPGVIDRLRLVAPDGVKRIPAEYLRASKEQRTLLLRGIMDADGCWNIARNRATVCSTSEDLARDYWELIQSLGIRARLTPVKASGFGVETVAWTIEFTPRGFNPFFCNRKAGKVTHFGTAVQERRVIRKIEPVEMVATQCIEVDSEDHTYLCGREFFVTHNTSARASKHYAVQLGIYANSDVYNENTDQRLTIPEYIRRMGFDPELWNPHVGIIWWVKNGRTQARVLDLDEGWRYAKMAYEITSDFRKWGVAENVTAKILKTAEEQGLGYAPELKKMAPPGSVSTTKAEDFFAF